MEREKAWGLRQIICWLIIAGLSVMMVLPLAWMISTSFKSGADVFKYPIEWILSRSKGFENYTEVWNGRMPLGLYCRNSIKTTVISVFLSLLIGYIETYGFSKIDSPGRDRLFVLYLTAMILPEQVTLIPRLLLFKQMGLVDSRWLIILDSVFSVMGVFILRQAIVVIPDEHPQATKIDGAGHLRTLLAIIVPTTKPSITTFVTLKFVWTWNDYQSLLVFLTNSGPYTIQLEVKMLSGAFGNFYALIMAAIVSAIVPLLIIFLIGWKQVIAGIGDSGVKG